MAKVFLAALKASVPCRIDCGGTVDIDPLALGLKPFGPATLNIALDLPTTVEVRPAPGQGLVIDSPGFGSLRRGEAASYASPLGFFLLAADYFGLDDLAITIRSASPPKSALGGSSAALVAAVAAFGRMSGRKLSRLEAAQLAHQIEQALFGLPCGRQDHLAAAFGGINLWTWTPGFGRGYKRRQLLKASAYPVVEARLLVAYPGQTHASSVVNSAWIEGFVSGRHRRVWLRIVEATKNLARAIEQRRWKEAADWLKTETSLRLELTPEVLTAQGLQLVQAAEQAGAGARFCGAGGGGCIYALGPKEAMVRLRPAWAEILAGLPGARFLPSQIDRQGLKLEIKKA